MKPKLFPEHLQEMQRQIEGFARELGLDFYPIVYEILDYKTMNEVAAFGGFPTRYPHWRFGMDYEQLSKGYEFGLQKIYEMVINTKPAYAYLLEGNSLVDQKTVMAHVCGHVDFFKNNYYFSKTNRKMIDGMANHASLVRKHASRLGIEKVESFIDVCLSIENLIDPMSPYIKRKNEKEENLTIDSAVPRLKAKGYMQEYVNPPEFLEAQRKKREAQLAAKQKFPEHPERDVLAFLIQNAPLEGWQRDVLEVIRAEAYYFAPQAMTKIMNEGWATYWHSTIMTGKAASAAEIVDYADACSGILASSQGQLNPYKLGVELFRDIERRWNKGQFGMEWERCDDIAEKNLWDTKAGLGREKIFEVRKLHNDVTFIDEFFTLEFCIENKFYSYDFNDRSSNWEIASRDFKEIKEKLLVSLSNRGQPVIEVVDGNVDNKGELLLLHRHDGVDLDQGHARDTLQNLHRIWTRPVNVETLVEGETKRFRWDNTGFSVHSVS